MKMKRKLVAIVFTDIAGYTALSAKDSHQTSELLKVQRKSLKPVVKKYGGLWMKEMGDGLLLTFDSATNAVECSIAIQKITKNIENLNLRIGIHEGEVIEQNKDIIGDDVNVASRIEPFSAIGGIAISQKVQQAISSNNDFSTKYIGIPKLKGVSQKIELYCINSHGLPEPDLSNISDMLVKVSNYNKKKITFTLTILISIAIFVFNSFISKDIAKKEKDDNFLIMISSNNQFIENTKKTDEWTEIEKNVQDYGLINDQDLSGIIKYVSTGLKRKFINNDIKLYFPKTIPEIDMLTELPHFDYLLHCRINDLVEEKDDFKKSSETVINHFNSKYFTNIDIIVKIDLFWFIPKEKQHLKIISFDYTMISFDYTMYRPYKNNELSIEYSYSSNDSYDVNVIDGDNIEFDILDFLYNKIMDKRYGKYIGSVNEILDSNLVTIKLSNLDLIKGINLKSERTYLFSKDNVKESLDYQIRDYETRNEYFKNNKEEILKWSTIEYYGDNIFTQDSSITFIMAQMINELDSLKNNYSQILDRFTKGGEYHRVFGEFDYSLEILKIQDSIATAKITKFPLPFVRPRIGDRMRVEE